MNWFERYAQQAAGAPAVPERGTPGQQAPPISGTPGMRVVFHGQEMNDAIIDNIIVPMNQLSEDTYKFLDNASNSELGRFLLKLSSEGKMENFRKVVESYVNEGYVDAVRSGTQDGMSALQEWAQQLYSYFDGATPFEGIDRDLTRAIGI